MAPSRLLTDPGTPLSSMSESLSPTDPNRQQSLPSSSDDGQPRSPFDSPFPSIPGTPLNGLADDLRRNDKHMPIAIIGLAVRAGAATNPLEFYEMLSRKRSAFSTEFPKERFNNQSFYHPNAGKLGCINTNGASFLKQDISKFDAPFFNLTELEATSMDPQQRMLLECAFEALESAGIPKHTTVGSDVGVFMGAGTPDYETDLMRDSDTMPMFQATGNALALQANRISHFFDWRGPSVIMDTACSASLTATHYACQSIRSGESKIALVGGCRLNVIPESFINFSTSRLFGNDGRSFSFDARGTGYGRGEGCGMILLKPLDAAIRDRDPIRAVIRASGVNQDGKTPGITMPNGEAQEALIKSIYKDAGLDPADCGYCEAHGTGTRVGDPIEVTALHNAFGNPQRTARTPLFLGSVKSNIGHLESASGILAVIKTALMLERGFVLPNYDFKTANPKIPLAKWGFKVPTFPAPWPKGKKYASVNNFGFGGTNAHLVLEKAPLLDNAVTNSKDAASVPIKSKLFVFTANDKVSCQNQMKNLGVYLEQRPEMFQRDLMSDVAYTLGQRRSLLSWRVAVPATDSFDLNQKLTIGGYKPIKQADLRRLGFVFTGQGAQWWAMGRELYDQYPVFSRSIDTSSRILKDLGAPYSLVEELGKDEKTTSVNEAHISQPSCTAIQLALVDLLHSWGVQPDAVVGHSSGEIGAAYAAGILTTESAMTIAYHRGRLVPVLKARFPDLQGSMLAVGCGKDIIEPLIEQVTAKELRIACYNSPQSLTISGDTPAIIELQKLLDERQIFNRKLMIETAYHSHHMELIADDYMEAIKHLPPPEKSTVRFYSSLTGEPAAWSELTPSYWVQNLTSSVRFAQALTHVVAPFEEHSTGVEILIELGPHAALQGPIKQTLAEASAAAQKLPYASALSRKKDAVHTALELASSLFCRGANLNFESINFPRGMKRLSILTDLPTYPWNHSTSYWHESRITKMQKHRPFARHDLLGVLANYSNELEPTWRNILRVDDLPWLRHHKIQSLTLFPISGFASMALEAASQEAILKGLTVEKFELKDVSVGTPLMIMDEDIEMTTAFAPRVNGQDLSYDFRIHSYTKTKGWTEHCTGQVTVYSSSTNEVEGERQSRYAVSSAAASIVAIKKAKGTNIEQQKLYTELSNLGVDFGPTFQGLTDCQATDKYATATVTVADTAADMPEKYETSYVIKPSFLEQLVQMYWPILGAGRETGLNTICLPAAFDKLTVSSKVNELVSASGQSLKAYCTATSPLSTIRSSKLSSFAAVGVEPIVALEGLSISPLPADAIDDDVSDAKEMCFKQIWEPTLQEASSEQTGSAPTTIATLPSQPVVIYHGLSWPQISLAQRLATMLQEKTGQAPQLAKFGDVNTEGKLVLCLNEIDEPLLVDLSEEDHVAVKDMVMKADGITWVVRGAFGQKTDPTTSLINGFSRAIRAEHSNKFATLDLDGEAVLGEEAAAAAILRVFTATMSVSNAANQEMEFRERNGEFFTPRVVNDDEANAYTRQKCNPSGLQTIAFGKDQRALKMVVAEAASLDSIHFVDDDAAQADLAEDEVEVEVKAIGVDARDVEGALGHIEYSKLGLECSGIVSRVGSSNSNLAVGDHVFALSQGSYSTFARAKSSDTFKIGAGVSFEDAATLPIAYSIAHYGLVDLAHLEHEESVLIFDGASPAGQAAIAVAQMIGSTVFATVENQQEKDLLLNSFDISERHIFYSKNSNLGNAVLHQTSGQGVDVIFSLPSESRIAESALQALRSFGRVIAVSSGAGAKQGAANFKCNTNFSSLNIYDLIQERPRIVSRVLKNVASLLRHGKIHPLAGRTTYTISEVAKAFRERQSHSAFGKSIIVPHAEDQVQATASQEKVGLFKDNATYILIGGTGGLGRSMARWMAAKGARTLVLLSRRGQITPEVQELIDELAPLAVNIVVRSCDISKKDAVDALIATELTNLPPIRGVIHGSMVLRDVLLEKQTYADYTQVLESKVPGAWNFHNALLSTPLDFFLCIASVSATMGPRGQSAYAAANSFLEAFCQYRLSLGLPAASVGPTAISDVGFLAENADTAAEVTRTIGSDSISNAEVLALLEASVDGSAKRWNGNHCITGVRIDPLKPGFWAADAKFKYLRIAAEEKAAEINAASGTAAAVPWNTQLKSAPSLADAEAVVCQGLIEKIAATLGIEKEDVEPTRTLGSLSLDSLTAIDVRNFIAREFEATLQVLELLSSGTVETLAKAVCVKSKIVAFEKAA